MKALFRDTIFIRLFGLVLGALLISQAITALLWFVHIRADDAGPPPLPAQHSPFDGPQAGPRPPELDARVLPGPAPSAQAPHDAPPPAPSDHPHDEHAHPPVPRELWLVQLLQLIALGAAAWVGARTLARPIEDLAHAAAGLGANLDQPPLAERGPLEAREAARGFNRMQARIRAQFDERTRFLAAVSHDLRTPLTRMKLRAERLADEQARERMHADITEMSDMLDATLGFLRGSAQQEPWQRYDVQALVESIAEDMRDAGRDVSVSGHADAIDAMPATLRRCVENLVENAVRYGQRARVTLKDGADALAIEIADDGPGIPENQMAAVFEPFVRLETSRSRETGGVGLGLSIARDAARRHGGELTLRNAPEGGLIARLILPRDR